MELNARILSDIVVHTKYARYIPSEKRRETWSEIVDRNKKMHIKKYPMLREDIESAYKYVYDKKILPSMRSLQFAGKPIQLNPARIYNCSFLPMDHPDSFSELMFLLLSGVGVGYSVQRHHIKKLPEIRSPKRTRRYLIGDSIEGWADSIKVLLDAYFSGKALPVFDFSDIRAKGERLVTSGGKAPGPEPLRQCLNHINNLLSRKEDGSRLSSLEIHDINCYIADAVLAGGIRRSAMIALFDLDDEEMLNAKGNFLLPSIGNDIQFDADNNTYQFYVEYMGERRSITLSNGRYDAYIATNLLPWYYVAPHRGRANNSATIVRHKIDKEVFMNLWAKIEDSGAGEPGIFFTNDKDWGLNPCAEISLRPYQFCNLTTINTSDITDQEDLNNRATAAAFIATLQASYTDFHYLRDIWKETTEKEALIGVSMTGIAAGTVLKLDLAEAAEAIKNENARVAKLIEINKSARTTTVKPEGTTSLVLGSSSGIHAWHNNYYIRRVKLGKNEALYHHLLNNHPELFEDDFISPTREAHVTVPIKAPDGSIIRTESALDLLNRVSFVWNNWVKPGHRRGSNINNVSTTVSIEDNEWKEVGEWMWKHRDEFTALSVLPQDTGTYQQTPFEDITKKKYEEMTKSLHEIDLSKVIEEVDGTVLQETVACGGNACEVS